jgi:methylmalonyl-CoA mutase N-terminal domain/subunit
VDPLAGSFAVEGLTDRIEAEASALLDEIDGLGGMVAAIEQGWPQKKIQDAAYAAQKAIESGASEVVGVNVHRLEHEPVPPARGLRRGSIPR